MRRNAKFDDFEKRISDKRQKRDNSNLVPPDIMVQRMSSTPSGRLKKFEPLDTRDFVPFKGFTELSIENIKTACELYYNSPKGTCDVLASDRGPSCTKIEQVKGKKVFFARFLRIEEVKNEKYKKENNEHLSTSSMTPLIKKQTPSTSRSTYAKSISIADLLNAGKLMKKREPVTLELDDFSVDHQNWQTYGNFQYLIEDEKFAEGAFREAYKAKAINHPVIKQYTEKSIDSMTSVLKMTPEDHTRKQVQMHAVARNISQRFGKNAPKEFGPTFTYNKVYFSRYNGLPVTVEEFVDGDFVKYINNDGLPTAAPTEELETIYKKAETLVHYSYVLSEEKLMLLDIQGSSYKLYDPEIATSELYDGHDESLFCSGNLSVYAIKNFKEKHKCSCYCRMMDLVPLEESQNE